MVIPLRIFTLALLLGTYSAGIAEQIDSRNGPSELQTINSELFNSEARSPHESSVLNILQQSSDLNEGKRTNPFGRSLLLPGWGQISQGSITKGYIFLGVELSLIAAYIGLRTQSNWLEEDYKAFAEQHAGVNGSHEHEYYVDIGNWNETLEFNEQRIRDRQFNALYRRSQDTWSWDSEENRRHFKSLRIDSDQADQTAMLMIGGLFLNHLLSAVDASSLTDRSTRLSLQPQHTQGIKINLTIY